MGSIYLSAQQTRENEVRERFPHTWPSPLTIVFFGESISSSRSYSRLLLEDTTIGQCGLTNITSSNLVLAVQRGG